MNEVIVREPDSKEFEEVKKYVKQFWLDDEQMLKEQFKILLQDDKPVAFGRLREKEDATELCTLGVLEEYRGRRLGSAMVKSLVSLAKKDVHVVSVIPGFFRKQGFIPVQEYPASIKKKVELCTEHYHVGVPYQVMKYKNQK